MVARPERDADERQVALERDLRDGAERPVAAGDAERGRIGGGARAGRVVASPSTCVATPRRLAAATSSSSRPSADPERGIHEQEARHRLLRIPFHRRDTRNNARMKLSYLVRGLPGHPLHPPLTDATIGTYTVATALAFADVTGLSKNAAAAGWWLALLFGLATTVLTALTGLVDWL